ncbi:hypothetical protein Cfor_00336 [Coptotermes formosanus]|uniref:Myb/SANT-like DNA-binding domain-containing protein n=1 Tax=Coptotermes formosanus TaxID=36987 RepID=A0A6L2P9E7_COPFO|nr:hypothetical protein Cfor_00336 [Coptotermes formosanus]
MTSSGRKKSAFTEEETSVLLDLWADDRIQAKFSNSFRHNLIWEDIALRMKGMGYNRNWKECYNRVANLKKAFARKKRDFKTGIADAADWTYWSHLESLLKSLPSSTKTVNEDEDEEDSSDQFLKELEPGCGDNHEEEDDNGEGEREDEIIIDDTASQLSDPFAVVMEDLDEDEDAMQPSHTMTATVPVQPSPTPQSHIKKKPVIRKSKRRAHSDDYYIRQLIENDRQMLQNQQRQLQLDEQVSTAAMQLFNAVTEYLNKMNSAMQPPTGPSTSPPTSIHNPVAASSCSKPSSDTEPSNVARTIHTRNSDSPPTVRSVKRLCTTDISQTLKCSGVANKVIVVPQEEDIN